MFSTRSRSLISFNHAYLSSGVIGTGGMLSASGSGITAPFFVGLEQSAPALRLGVPELLRPKLHLRDGDAELVRELFGGTPEVHEHGDGELLVGVEGPDGTVGGGGVVGGLRHRELPEAFVFRDHSASSAAE